MTSGSTLAAIAGLLTIAAVSLAMLGWRWAALRSALGRLRKQNEMLLDRQWEMREAEERMKSLLEVQGDLIVRRDADGNISYVSDGFCSLVGLRPEDLIGRQPLLPILEQGPVTILPDGTRTHDEKIETPAGARWIACHEFAVRVDRSDRPHTQSVGRD